MSLQYVCVSVCVCGGGGGVTGVCRARAHVQSFAASLVRTCDGGEGGGGLLVFFVFFLTVRTARFTFDTKIEEQALVLLLW